MFCLGLSAWKAPLHPSFCCRKWAGLPQIAIKPCSGNGTPADALPPIECTAAVLDISLNLFVSWKLNLRRFLTFHTGIPDTMLYICMQCPAALRSTAHPCADLKSMYHAALQDSITVHWCAFHALATEHVHAFFRSIPPSTTNRRCRSPLHHSRCPAKQTAGVFRSTCPNN